jgi:hypothetical protein
MTSLNAQVEELARMDNQYELGVENFPPRALGHPPYDIASSKDEKQSPAIRAKRHEAHAHDGNRNDHGKIIGTGVSAMRTATLSGHLTRKLCPSRRGLRSK